MAGVLGLAVATASWASEPSHAEVEVVRAALDSPVVVAAVEAGRTRARAWGTAGPWLPDPTLEVRQEQANGPAGNATQIVGGSVVLQPGWPGPAAHRAATLRGQAGEAWIRVELVATICEVRGAALDAWLTEARRDRASAAHARLTTLHQGAQRLAEAGEIAGYDRDRIGLTLARHRVDLDRRRRDEAAAVARLHTWLEARPEGITLLPLPSLPALEQAAEDALRDDPTLQALRREREAAHASLTASRRAALPDLTVSGGARWDALPDGSARTPGYEVGLAVDLPAFDRNQVATREGRAQVARLDARITRRAAEVRAAVGRSWTLADALGPLDDPPATAVVWDGARLRWARGEASIDELLLVADEVEATELAHIDALAMRRRARLSLSCTVGRFPEAPIQTLLEEALR